MYDKKTFLEDYIVFMTTANTHNDTYAESYHRDFFANWAKGSFNIHTCYACVQQTGRLLFDLFRYEGFVPIRRSNSIMIERWFLLRIASCEGVPPERCAGKEGHDTPSIGAFVSLPLIVFQVRM